MDLKPKIFIGSSGSAIETAKKVLQCLSRKADCYLWKDSSVWEPNRSTFDNLLRLVNFFDFGVFIATSDDVVISKDKVTAAPRDNVILEMALFLGALGL